MAHLEPLPRDSSPELEAVFDAYEESMGFLPNSLLIMQRKPEIVQGFAALSAAVFLQADGVEPGFKQLVAHVASGAAGCQYCQAHTVSGAGHAGVSDEKLDAVWEYAESDLFTEKERVALDFALAAGSVPNEVDADTMVALKAHWTDDEIVELLAAISLFGFLNRWNDSLATDLEATPRDAGKRFLSDRGWDGGKHVTDDE